MSSQERSERERLEAERIRNEYELEKIRAEREQEKLKQARRNKPTVKGAIGQGVSM